MEFEYDPAKSRANEAKHGIGFEEARQLWDDGAAIAMAAFSHGEARHLIVGRIQGRHWTAVVTYRGAKVRIISVRRARQHEIEDYKRG